MMNINTQVHNRQSGAQQKTSRINLVILIILLITSTIYSVFRENNGITVTLKDNSVIVSGPEDFSFSVPCAEIVNLEIIDAGSVDAGTLISGTAKNGCQYGTWENSSWGQYTQCIIDDISCQIILTTEDGSVYSFNCEDDDTTVSFYSALSKLLAAGS